MNQPLVSLAAGVMPEFTPEQTAAAAIAAGWPAVGIWVDPALWTATTAAEVRARTSDAGVQVLDVEVIWLKPGADDPDHFRIIDAGAAVGARHALIVSSDPDPHATAAKLGRLASHAAGCGMQVSLEFAAFTEVRSLAAARAILESPGAEQVGLLIDPLHLARTGGTPEALRDLDPARFHYAQICDAAATGPAPEDVEAIIHEALDLRLDIGEGKLPLAALLDILPDQTALSVELRSKALRHGYPDPADRARALLAATISGLANLRRSAIA